MSDRVAVVAPTTHAGHEVHHEELGFWRKYVFSTDHKVIGIQYAVTGLLFLLFGFSLMMLMRWQLAYPGAALPLIGGLFGDARMPGRQMLPEFYNELGAMHGTIMVFLGVVPLAVGGFGNFVLPLQIGAPDMAFPRINMASYWSYFLGGVTMLLSFLVPGGAAQSGGREDAMLAMAEPAAGEDDRQIRVGVRVGVAHAAAEEHHRMVQQRAIVILHSAESLQVFRKQLGMISVDFRHLGHEFREVVVMRQRVVCFRHADLRIGPRALFLSDHE